jgi:hypothetical protein
MTSGILVGFILSITRIMLYPLKVEAIFQLPPPCTIPQLQISERKENFLRRFVTNYVKITKGFIHILKKWVPFCWDQDTQFSFEALKCSLMSSPLLWPPDYNKYFLFYVAATEMTIGMVLVQKDDMIEDHVIYYLVPGLVGLELNYSHFEKLALATVHAFQRFCHYIFLCKTTVIFTVNHFQYVLTRWVIGGNISRWIVILQYFDLDFVSTKSKKSLVFAELISKLSVDSSDIMPEESLIKGDIFLIAYSDPWYGDILVYL